MAEKAVLSVSCPQLNKDETTALARSLGIFTGRPIDEQKLDDNLKSFFEKGKFDRLFVYVEDKPAGVEVMIDAERLRRIKTVTFVNIDSDVLEEVRSRVNWEEGQGADPRTFAVVKERLKVAYENQGYFNAVVQSETKQIPGSDESRIEVSVERGDPAIVNKIIVSAGDKDEEKSLLDEVKLVRGEIYTRALAEASVERINKYLQNNQYSTSRVEDWSLAFSPDRKSVDVTFMVKLGDRFQFQFVGNRIFDEYELRSVMSDEVLSQMNATAKIVELIESKYRAAGYHFVQVKVTSQQRRDDTGKSITIYKFEIDEGEKVLVDKLHFTGGLAGLSEGELEDIFISGASGAIARRVYWEEGMRDSVASFKTKLERLGYLSASVSSPRAAFSQDNRGVELFFDVELGSKTIVKDVVITGNHFLDSQTVRNILDIHRDDPFNREKLKENKEKLLKRYRNSGFVDVKLTQELDKGEGIELSRDLKTVIIHIDIIEGTRFFVGRIVVEGNRKTKEEVILREMKISQGEAVDPERIARSEEDIGTLGLFSRVEIVSATNSEKKDQKDLKIIVRENKPGVGEVGFGGFYEDPRFRLRTFFGVTYRNMLGLNQTGSGRIEFSVPFSRQKSFIPFLEYSGALGYRSPYPFNIPVTFIGQLTFDSFEVKTVDSETTIQSRTKIEGRIEKKFNPNLTGIYRLYQLERTRLEILDKADSGTIDIIGSTGPGVILDFRDDIYNPTRGSYHSLFVEVASPLLLSGPEISFAMALSRNTLYVPLFAGLGLSFYAGLGYAQTLFPGSAIPAARLTNDLSLGGRGSIRGFSVRRFAPSDPTRIIERTAFYNGRAELNVPLFSNFSGAIFMDTGQIYPNLAPDKRHDGVGLGVRYKTPIGPVVVDIAQGLGEDREELKFYFTVGTF